MLGVRLKTWVKTHLGRERHQHGSSTTHSNSFISSPRQIPPLSSLSSTQFQQQFMSPTDNNAAGGALAISSPDTGYSTDGLSKTASNSTSSILTTATTNPQIQVNNNPYSASSANTNITKREWFLHTNNSPGNSSSSPPRSTSPSRFRTFTTRTTSPSTSFHNHHQHQNQQQHQLLSSNSLKPTRIKTNPWYNPKSKRLTNNCSSTFESSPVKNNTQNNKDNHSLAEHQQQHPRLSACTNITTDSGEGSFDSQKSSPRVSFSSSSLESYPPTTTEQQHNQQHHYGLHVLEDWKNKCSRLPSSRKVEEQGEEAQAEENRRKSSSLMHDYSRREKVIEHGEEEDGLRICNGSSNNSKSPFHKINSWYQPSYGTTNTSSKNNNALGQCSQTTVAAASSPYFIHNYNLNNQHGKERKLQEEILSPKSTTSAGKSKRTFNFLRKLFKKGQNKKRNSSKTSSEVSIHDFYYHQNPNPIIVGAATTAIRDFNNGPSTSSSKISSFLTPTPNAFRRRTIIDASLPKKIFTPHIGYTNRPPPPPIPVFPIQTATRLPITPNLRRVPPIPSEFSRATTNENIPFYATANIRPKLTTDYCSPTSRQKDYSDYYSSPPPPLPPVHAAPGINFNNNSPGGLGRHFTNTATISTTSPITTTHYNYNETVTPSKRSTTAAGHIINRKLILQSPIPFVNNTSSSCSPLHRVAVLKGSGNNGTCTNPMMMLNRGSCPAPNNNNGNSNTFTFNNCRTNILRNERPEFFSPQFHHHQQSHSSRFLRNTNIENNPEQQLSSSSNSSCYKNPYSSTFYSPQPQPASARARTYQDSRSTRRCFQYISSSNQNSPILNAHCHVHSGGAPNNNSRQNQSSSSGSGSSSSRFSPIISPAFNHHRVHPIKNYILSNSPVRKGSVAGGGNATTNIITPKRFKDPHPPQFHSNNNRIIHSSTPTKNIDKIYEEIDDDDEEQGATRSAIIKHHGIDRETAILEDTHDEEELEDEEYEEESDPAAKVIQNYSDEGDEQGGVYYQLDYDSSLLSTTEESQETSTASTSTLLKTINEQRETPPPISASGSRIKDRHQQTLPLSSLPSTSSNYAIAVDGVVDKQQQQDSPTTMVPVAGSSTTAVTIQAGLFDNISPTTRHLLEIENDLRFCRLIAEAQTLLRELENNTVSSLTATKNGLEEYYKQSNLNLRQPITPKSSTYQYRRNTTARGTSFASSSSNNNGTAASIGFDDCPQSDPLKRKAYECWALRRLQQELAGCCASPLAFRHNLVPRQQIQKNRQSSGVNSSTFL